MIGSPPKRDWQTSSAVSGVLPSLRVNCSWAVIGNASYAASQWGILAILSKLRSQAELGTFVYALALVTPVYVFAQLQLRPLLATDAKQEFSTATYLILRITCVILASLGVLAALIFARPDAATLWACAFLAIARASESMSDLFYGLMQARERMRLVATSLCLKAVLSLTLLGAGLYVTNSIVGAAAGLAIAWASLLLVYDIPTSLRLIHIAPGSKPRAAETPSMTAAIRALLKRAVPLGLVMLLGSLNTNIPRYFLKAESGAASLGIFAALSYVQVAGSTLVTSLGQSAAPRLAKAFQNGDIRAFRRLLLKLLAIVTLLGSASFLFALTLGGPLLAILYRPEYAAHNGEFAVIAAASTFLYVASILGFGMTAAMCYRPQVVVISLSTSALCIACYLLVPRYSLYGAAAAVAVCNFTLLTSSAYVLWSATRGHSGSRRAPSKPQPPTLAAL